MIIKLLVILAVCIITSLIYNAVSFYAVKIVTKKYRPRD
jgi:hypothetical protein